MCKGIVKKLLEKAEVNKIIVGEKEFVYVRIGDENNPPSRKNLKDIEAMFKIQLKGVKSLIVVAPYYIKPEVI